MNKVLLLALVAAFMLQGCNSEDPPPKEEPPPLSEYERLRAAAVAKASEVRSLVNDSPCTQSSQCSSLVLQHRIPPCLSSDRYDYSLVSSTAAAASAAAADYNALSEQAYAVRPPSNGGGSCSVFVDLTPLNCVANRCVRQYVFTPPVTSPQPEGVWVSTALQVFVSLGGAVWAVDTSAIEPTIYTGALVQQDTALSASLERVAGSVAAASTLIATIADSSPKTIAVTRLDGFAAVPTTLVATSNFFSTSSLSQVAGTYTLSSGERIVLEASGVVRSLDAGCTTTGSFTAAWSDRNVYHLGFVFGPAPCRNPNAVIQGVLAPLPDAGLMAVVKRTAPNATAITMARSN